MKRDLRSECNAYVQDRLAKLSPQTVSLLDLRDPTVMSFTIAMWQLQFSDRIIDELGE